MKGPASNFANMSPGECSQQLKLTGELGKAFGAHGKQNGVATPLHFVAPLDEVTFQVPPPKVSFGVLDCREALLWIHLLPTLKKHEIVKIRIDNFYRDDARIGRGKKSQHAYGLAADIVSITLRDGREINVLDDFLGRRGEVPCGPDAAIRPRTDSSPDQRDKAVHLRNFVCELARMGAFHHILTPNYNQAHENHLHLDLKRENKWFSVQ